MHEEKEMCRTVSKTVDTHVTKDRGCSNGLIQQDVQGQLPGMLGYPQNPLEYKQDCMLTGQTLMGQDIKHILHHMGPLVSMATKNRRREIDGTLISNENNELVYIRKYDDGTSDYIYPCIVNSPGEFLVAKLSIADDKYRFVLISIGKKVCITLPIDKLTPNTLYNALVEKGIRFDVGISQRKVAGAVYVYVISKIEANECSKRISGLAGWEDGKFLSAESVDYLENYKYDYPLPIFKKSMPRGTENMARIPDYVKCFASIKEEQLRIWFSILPMAAMILSLFVERNLYKPFVINFIVMSNQMNTSKLEKLMQVFSRKCPSVYSVDDTSKNIRQILADNKDEITMFLGILDEDEQYYKFGKITKNLRLIAKKALRKSGIEYEGKEVESIVTLFSNQRIAISGVRNLFLSDEIFEDEEEDTLNYEAISNVYSMFVSYIEYALKDIKHILSAECVGESATERYWRGVLGVVRDFWLANGYTLESILGVEDSFDFSFLWQDTEVLMEDVKESIVLAVKMAMPWTIAVQKTASDGTDDFVFEDKYIWIKPDLFEKMLSGIGMAADRNRLLLGAKDERILITSDNGGYTSRLQTKNKRCLYYRFDRSAFTKSGDIELLDLAKEVRLC